MYGFTAGVFTPPSGELGHSQTAQNMEACNCLQLIIFIRLLATLYVCAVSTAFEKLKPEKTHSTMFQGKAIYHATSCIAAACGQKKSSRLTTPVDPAAALIISVIPVALPLAPFAPGTVMARFQLQDWLRCGASGRALGGVFSAGTGGFLGSGIEDDAASACAGLELAAALEASSSAFFFFATWLCFTLRSMLVTAAS